MTAKPPPAGPQTPRTIKAVGLPARNEYDQLWAYADTLEAELAAARGDIACINLALDQVYRMFDPPLVGTVGLKVQIAKLRELASTAEAALAAAVARPRHRTPQQAR